LGLVDQAFDRRGARRLRRAGEVEFSHHMAVTRIHESPRVTRPYAEEQWAEVLALGEAVDRELEAGDVRLTMGGEPTFVAVSDRDAAEWNTDALGPTKRGYATELVHKLRAEYGDGGFLHFGQGKWYPGEQLPRWALSIYWRADGQPCWNNPALFADERTPTQYTSEDARRFVERLCAKLGLTDKHVQPGYEDVFYYLWRERKLPVNVDPFDSRLDDELERTRLRRVFTQKLDSVVGYALPLQAGDPFEQRAPLPTATTLRRQLPGEAASHDDATLPPASAARYGNAQDVALHRAGGTGTGTATTTSTRVPDRHESAHWLTRTALCVEVRDPQRANGPKAEREHGGKSGALYVFMPPLSRLEDYLELLAAVEATAQDLGVQIVLEGYTPPRDPRLKVLQVTPDPGVIEVNIHPAHNWGELVDHTEFLYQAAFECRLSAEKFMTDGRHTGTGGGNHFVLGGATPADSPFLRRPELLASLLLYWHNHPSLSYLFSGMFIGPTSQAPRVDEARNDQLYELEIALKEIERNRQVYGQAMPPWIVDRTLRNILVDVTGNT
ncbi:MAG: IMP dehydrogenase, partial [Comamonadaceae bacterium]